VTFTGLGKFRIAGPDAVAVDSQERCRSGFADGSLCASSPSGTFSCSPCLTRFCVFNKYWPLPKCRANLSGTLSRYSHTALVLWIARLSGLCENIRELRVAEETFQMQSFDRGGQAAEPRDFKRARCQRARHRFCQAPQDSFRKISEEIYSKDALWFTPSPFPRRAPQASAPCRTPRAGSGRRGSAGSGSCVCAATRPAWRG